MYYTLEVEVILWLKTGSLTDSDKPDKAFALTTFFLLLITVGGHLISHSALSSVISDFAY